jgi:hypothetical protein
MRCKTQLAHHALLARLLLPCLCKCPMCERTTLEQTTLHQVGQRTVVKVSQSTMPLSYKLNIGWLHGCCCCCCGGGSMGMPRKYSPATTLTVHMAELSHGICHGLDNPGRAGGQKCTATLLQPAARTENNGPTNSGTCNTLSSTSELTLPFTTRSPIRLREQSTHACHNALSRPPEML